MDNSLEDHKPHTGEQKQQQEQEEESAIATNDLPAPEEAVRQVSVVVGEEEEHGEHAAFLPSLQFTSGNDLSSIAHYDPQHVAAAAGGNLRTGEQEQAYDHWPSDTQTQVQEEDAVAVSHDAGVGYAQQDGSLVQGGHEEQQQEQQQQQQQQEQQMHPVNPYESPGHQQIQHAMMHPYHHAHGGTPYDRPTPGASYGTYDGSKPKRKRASPQQLTLLNNIFEMTYFPSSDLRLAIGKELDMVPRSVQIWFQNRRSLWRAKAQQILADNVRRKQELLEQGIVATEAEADQRVAAERSEVAAREMASQRANDAVEYAINGHDGSLAYALHGGAGPGTAMGTAGGVSQQGGLDDGSVARDDEAGAWSVLQAFHQARTGVLVQQGHPAMSQQQRSDIVAAQP